MSSTNIAYKSVPGQFNIDAAQGIVECFVAGIGNKDSVGDVLVTGAFAKSLTRRKPRVVWGHNWNDPIGKVLEIYEVPPSDSRLPMKMKAAGIGGLYARVQFNLNSEKGKEAFANVAFFGQEQEWSIGYKTLDAIFDPNLQANILKEVELYEVSPVLHGANQLTGTISVKSDETAEKCGPGMMMPHHMNMEQGPKIVVVRQDDEEDDKPIFSEGLAQPIGGSARQRLSQELQSRSGSPIQLVEATENTAIFRRNTSDGRSTMYRIGYHTPDNYVTFMFGKPELADGGASGSRTVVPSQMPMMPMQVKPQAAMPEPQAVTNPSYVMPKSDGFEKSAFDEELEMLAEILDDTFDAKVGRTLSSRNMSKLKTVLETLQDIVASADKDIEVKSDEYIIPVALEDAFSTKQLLDPIFDYHRVESHVSEDGIIITSGVTKDFLDAMETAQKALGGRIGGGGGKARGVARFATEAFDPNAVDGDNDGLVQEGSAFERPATPNVGGLSSLDDRQIFNKPKAEKNEQGLNVLDSHVLADRMKGMSLSEAAKKHGIPVEKVRQSEAREMARLRNSGSTNDIIAYRMMGVSVRDTAKMFDKTPEEVRKLEIQELAKFKKDPTDDVILDFRERGLSLDEVAKMTGLKNTEVRKREQIARRDRPEIPDPGKDLTDEDVSQWAKDRGEGGLSSRAEIVSKDDLPKEIVTDIGNAAIRAVGSKGDETRIIDGAKEVLTNLTDEKLKDSVGNSVSNARKKLAEMFSDEKIIEEFSSPEAIDDFMDEMRYSIQKMLDSHVDSIKKTGTSLEKEEIENIVDNADSDLDDNFNKLISRAKDFWGKRRQPGEFDRTLEDAKNEAGLDKKLLITSLKEGGSPEDLEETLRLMSGVTLTRNQSEEIINGKMSLEDFNYEIERAIEGIIENDPSIEPEELVNEFADALREGASKDGANPLIVSLAKEFGDEKITGGDLIDYLKDTRQNSVYRPDRGKIEKENIRGLASRNSRGASNLPYSANLTEDEISQLKEDLKDIDGVQDIVKRLEEATPSRAMDSQRIRMTPQEIDQWLKDIETARESMPGIEGNALGDIEDILNRAKNDAYGTFTSPSVSRRTRPLRTESGTINTHPKLDIELSQDEIGLLREEIAGLIKGTSKPESLRSLDETLSKASNGKFSVSGEEFNSLVSSIEEAKEKNGMVTSDLLGLLEQVADSKDGKYSSIELAKTGVEGGIGKSTRLNSGAPADMTVGRQRELIDWARKQKGLRIAQSHIADFDKNNGQLSPSKWRALETLHTNLGPGSARSTGGLRSSADGDAPKPRSVNPGGGARGIGDVTRGESTRGRPMGGEQLGERDTGKPFDELKPDNWNELDNEEKLDWLLYEGSPAKSGMKPIDHERVMKQLFEEEDRINARKERESRRAARPADWVPPKIESKPLQEAKPAKERPTTEAAASKQRDRELSNLVDFVSSSASRVNDAKQTEDMEAAHEDIWSELDDVLSGSDDLTRSNISAMIESLNTYIDDYAGNTNNKEEGKNVTRAKKLLKTLEDLDLYYEDDKFITDGDVVGNERPSFGAGGMSSRNVGLSSFSLRRNKPEESKTPRVVKPKKKMVTDNWKKVGGQGGSQPGGKFVDENGKEFYVKEPKTLLHAENESLVSKLYAALGVKAADVEVGEHKGKPKIISEWVPGAKTGIMGTKRNDPEWRKKVQSGFVADAWLANWDALGNSENIAQGGDGEAYRVDTGGGILFRARGAEKGAQFGNTVGEMESLRNPSVNSLGAAYYGDITPEQIAAQVKTVGALSDSDIRDMVSASISDPAQAKKISDTLIARRDDLVKNWSTGVKGGRSGGLSSRSEQIGMSPEALEAQKEVWKKNPEYAKLVKTIDEFKKASEAKYGKPGVVDRTSGLRSSAAKPGRTMITDEATYFGEVESSLPKEIEAARKASDKATVDGLQKLLDLIRKQEASKTGSRRTNVGSIYATRDEVDQILDAMMVALDRQMSRGDGKGENRIKLYSKLIEMLAAAGMSTFIDRDTEEIGSRTSKRTNSQGRNISIPNT